MVMDDKVKEATSRKKDTHKAMCIDSTENILISDKTEKNKAKKAVSRAMRENGEERLTELKNFPNEMLGLAKGLKIDSKEVE